MNSSTELKPELTMRSPIDLLRGLYQARRERNSIYSMSSFARDLGISTSLLSRIFSGSRPLSLKLAMHITTALELDEANTKAILLSVLQSSSKNAKISKKFRAKLEKDLNDSEVKETPLYTTLEIERFKAMSNWYHLAILNLTTHVKFDPSPSWIAKQLGISNIEAQDAVERLIGLGLLKEEDETLQRTSQNFYIKTHRSESAMRKFHDQMIGKAKEELEKTSDEAFSKRLINGITFVCSSENIEVIKDKIDKFEDEILAIAEKGERKNLYQMNVQFFPLMKGSIKE